MKNSKTLLIVMGLVVVGLLASCKKNNGDNNLTGEGFEASIEKTGGNGSKTHINPDWTQSSTQLLWTLYDPITVRNNNGTGATIDNFLLTEGQDSEWGYFHTGTSTDGFFEPNYAAIYPSKNTAGVANSVEGTTGTFNLPATQVYTANSFGEGAMPMVAYSSSRHLYFKNVLGGICFPLLGEGTVTKVELTTYKDEALWGTCTATLTGEDNSASFSSITVTNSDATAKKTLTLTCSGGVTLNSTTATDFIMMVPAGTLKDGFSVTFYNGDDVLMTKATTPGQSYESSPILRSSIAKPDQSLVLPLRVHIISPFMNGEDLRETGIDPTYIVGTAINGIPAEYQGYGFLYFKDDDIPSVHTTPEAVKAYLQGHVTLDNVGAGNVTQLPASDIEDDGSFMQAADALEVNTIYWVRAYAINVDDTPSYSDDIIPFSTWRLYFSTSDGDDRQGVMRKRTADGDGEDASFGFSVASGRQVEFSMGNLFYHTDANPYVGLENHLGDPSGWYFFQKELYQGEMDDGGYMNYFTGTNANRSQKSDYSFLAWGTSNYPNGQNSPHYYMWYVATGNNSNYYQASYDESNNPGNNILYQDADWGYNRIGNAGNTAGSGWRTPTKDEWQYLLDGRTDAIRYLMCSINWAYFADWDSYHISTHLITLNGHTAFFEQDVSFFEPSMLLFPDGFVWPERYVERPQNFNAASQGENAHRMTIAEFSILQHYGAIQIPLDLTGVRKEAYGDDCYYWTATEANADEAYVLDFERPEPDGEWEGDEPISLTYTTREKNETAQVRLVRNKE